MKRSVLCLFLACLFLMTTVSCSTPKREQEAFVQISDTSDVIRALQQRDGYGLRAAVLYYKKDSSATLTFLQQSLVVNLEADSVDVSEQKNWDMYDILYLDESILDAPDSAEICQAVASRVEQGGSVLVPNAFHDAFPLDFFGVSEFRKIEAFPETPDFPPLEDDLAPLQAVVRDFHTIYQEFSDIAVLREKDYGYGAVVDSASALVSVDGTALYTVNRFGSGYVLFVNPLLPNDFVGTSFTMRDFGAQDDGDAQRLAFASTASSCGQLFVNGWASFVSKQLYGFSLQRVFGSYGTPSMSWQLHYEDITGIGQESAMQFAELCRNARQVPSFSLVRSSYWWTSRRETLTYLLNAGGKNSLRFPMDFYESAYSSGKHIDSAGQWLNLAVQPNGGSYFIDYPEQRERLVPCAADVNGDGRSDFFCGSSDGTVTYFENLGFTGLDGRLRVSEGEKVRDISGGAIQVKGGFAAPQVFDLNGDGVLDLLLGGADGKVYQYHGAGDGTYADAGLLLDTEQKGQCLPSVGDLDGDGVADLLVGTDQGICLCYFGVRDGAGVRFGREKMRAYSRFCADAGLGGWLSPTVCDYNGDGIADVLMGTFEGYTAQLRGTGGGDLVFDGYLSGGERNYKGNDRLKIGMRLTPLLCDLNGDGALDLLCGAAEYGLAYPIDSPYFPYREELQRQVDYLKEQHYYLGVHFYTNEYASARREAYELAAHKKAMESYGIPLERLGANQHTWFTSRLGSDQTLRAIEDAGLLWESGFLPANATFRAPQLAAENVIALPFFLTDEAGEQTLLIQNNSVLPYREELWSDLSAKYEMPVCAYYHCDQMYRDDTEARSYVEKIETFRQRFGYQFVKEDQMMYASAAAYRLRVEVAPSADGFTIKQRDVDTSSALYDASAQAAAGLRIELSRALDGARLTTDANVWRRTADGLALGVDKTVSVAFSDEADRVHLTKVNVPAQIEQTDAGASLVFRGDGMMQVSVSGAASTADEGWIVDTAEGETVFTKFGAASALHIDFSENA